MNTTTTTMTTTTTTNPIEWFQHFYQPTTSSLGGRPSDAPTISTTTTLPPNNYSSAHLGFTSPDSCPTTVSNATPPTGSAKLSPVQEGRVAKPARRRTRASRKNPTTLLNTDTTNFRAMVQRYTGGANPYSPPFDSPAGFMTVGGGLHLGQTTNFNQTGSGLLGLHNYGASVSPGGVDLQAHQLHQQLLQQYGVAAFSSMANINAGSTGTRGGAVDHRAIGLGVEEGVSSLSHAGSLAGPGSGHYSDGGGENKRGGFMF